MSDNSQNGIELFTDYASSTQAAFDYNGANYVADDRHRGDDLDILWTSEIFAFMPLNLAVLYAGCGPGTNFPTIAKNEKISLVVGMDTSKRMLALSNSVIKYLNMNMKPLLMQMDMTKRGFNAVSFNVVLCLNNTLGNLPHPSDLSLSGDVRARTLQGFARLLSPSGILFLSVYNAERFRCKPSYSDLFDVIAEESNPRNFDFLLSLSHTALKLKLYSHWFKRDEIENLVCSTGFRLIELHEVESRLVILANKR